jgi:tetratricopeptide (TPR) repeat protein
MIDPPIAPYERRLAEALAHHEAQRWAEADKLYRLIIAQRPRWAPGLWNYGRMLHGFGHQQKAALCRAAELYSATLKADGDDCDLKAEAFNNLGTILLGWGHIAEAKGCFERCLALRSGHPHARVNLGIACRVAGELHEASAHQNSVLLDNPDNPEAHFESAFIRLTMGDISGGFEEYEWRWQCDQFLTTRLVTNRPRWEGEDLVGKRILLWHEQGLGDTLMFCRYARLVKYRGAEVWLQCPPELVRLMGSVPGIDRAFAARADDDNDFDCHCPLLSLPRVLKTRHGAIPCEIPYVKNVARIDTERPRMAKRIGIVWAGRPEHGGDRWRSTKLEQWKLLFGVPGIEWYSLQMGVVCEQLKNERSITDLTDGITDFADTAERLAGLDLLISVDTAVVHLAGAMGKPVWCLLPWSPDWRWMLEREDSPWYPTLRLFRQQAKGEWRPVFDQVKANLVRL